MSVDSSVWWALVVTGSWMVQLKEGGTTMATPLCVCANTKGAFVMLHVPIPF